jgi:hypothetical protein
MQQTGLELQSSIYFKFIQNAATENSSCHKLCLYLKCKCAVKQNMPNHTKTFAIK